MGNVSMDQIRARRPEPAAVPAASEVVREALRLMEEKDRVRAAKLEQLRDDIRQGIDSGSSQTWSSEEVKREGRARRAPKPA